MPTSKMQSMYVSGTIGSPNIRCLYMMRFSDKMIMS